MQSKAKLALIVAAAILITTSGCSTYAAVKAAESSVMESTSAEQTKEPTETAAAMTTETIAVLPAETTAQEEQKALATSASTTATASLVSSSQTAVSTTAKPTTAKPTAAATTKATVTTAETTEQPANPNAGIDVYPDPTPVPVGTYSADMAQQVLVLVNQARAEAGYPVLTWNATIAAACDVRAKEIVEHFGHTRPDGTSERTASDGLALGENIAMGRDLDSAQAAFDCWMESPPHKDNLIGVAYDYTISGVSCYCVNGVYYWVQEFG